METRDAALFPLCVRVPSSIYPDVASSETATEEPTFRFQTPSRPPSREGVADSGTHVGEAVAAQTLTIS
jgi:hypothetical protein